MYYSLTQKLMALPDDMVLFRDPITHRSSTPPWANRRKVILIKIFLVKTVPDGDGILLRAAD
jgi:hypothetical protein